MAADMSKMYAVVLCGGLGKRLRKIVGSRPKPMVLVNGRPFLDFVIERLLKYDISNIILCAGYKSDTIKKYYNRKKIAANIVISNEKKPLDTAGAVKNANSKIKSNPFFVLNGDSICTVDFSKMLDFHIRKRASATIALTKMKKISDYGVVALDSEGKITAFNEKRKDAAAGLVNSGVYVFDKKVLSSIPCLQKYSLEYDLFPRLKNCYGYVTKATLLDIGTPERYRMAEKFLNMKSPSVPLL